MGNANVSLPELIGTYRTLKSKYILLTEAHLEEWMKFGKMLVVYLRDIVCKKYNIGLHYTYPITGLVFTVHSNFDECILKVVELYKAQCISCDISID